MIQWRLIIEDFEPNIQHISKVDNIVTNRLNILESTTNGQDNTSTRGEIYSAKIILLTRIYKIHGNPPPPRYIFIKDR